MAEHFLNQRQPGFHRVVRPAAGSLRVLSCAAFLLAAGGLAPGALRADTIELSSGKRLENVTIVSARWNSVQYKEGKRTAALRGAQVRTLERSGVVLDRIRQLISKGELDKADATIKNMGTDPGSQAEAMYLAAKGRAAAGDPKAAAQAYKAYLDKFKDSEDWFVPFATLGMAEAYLAAKNPKTALAHFKTLEAFGGGWVHRARLGEADSILASRGAAGALDARRLYDQVARSSSANVELRQLAYVGRARAYLLQKQPDAAIKELTEKMFDQPKPQALAYSAERAEASLLLGRAYMALGGKKNLEQAELWLLRVPALYSEYRSVYEAACDALVEVYGKLNNTKRAAEWKARKAGGAGQ